MVRLRPTRLPGVRAGLRGPHRLSTFTRSPVRGGRRICSLSGNSWHRQEAHHAALGHRIDLDQPSRPGIRAQHFAFESRAENRRGGAVFEASATDRSKRSKSPKNPSAADIATGTKHGDGGAVSLCVFEPTWHNRTCPSPARSRPPAAPAGKATIVVLK